MLTASLGWVRRVREEGRLAGVSRQVRREGLTYLAPVRLRTLERCAEDVNRRRVPGDFVEAGVALGGSAIVLASLMGDGRSFHGFDVFGTIPPPGPNDPPEAHQRYAVIASGQSRGIRGGATTAICRISDHVAATFERYGWPVDGSRVSLHQGLFEDTLKPRAPVALAHVDSDWYEPVRTCLERIAPYLHRAATSFSTTTSTTADVDGRSTSSCPLKGGTSWRSGPRTWRCEERADDAVAGRRFHGALQRSSGTGLVRNGGQWTRGTQTRIGRELILMNGNIPKQLLEGARSPSGIERP